MKVFISWGGDRSKQLAEAIHWWLPHVLQFTRPYFTPVDIDKGKRWNTEISKELGQTKIGLIAMTPESLTSSWIMFEAGAISRVVEEGGLVCPIVFGSFGIKTTDLVGPLANFQAIEFNRDEVRQLLTTINKAAKEAGLSERTLDEAFDKWWPDLEQKVTDISSTAQPTTSVTHRGTDELLQEVVENTRAIIRELQAPVAVNPQVAAATALGFLQGGRTPLQAVLDQPATSDAVPVSKADVVIPKPTKVTTKVTRRRTAL